jgi:hypothetical protein
MISYSNSISVSVPIINLTGLRVMPNPANDFFTLESYQPGQYQGSTVELINLSGKVVSSFGWNGKPTQVDVASFSSGLYLIKVTGKYGVEVVKLVIQ